MSRAEAEILFTLNDRTAAADNAPEWTELFVKAIAGSVMAAATAPAPTRAEAAAREAWLRDERADPADFLKRMATGSWKRLAGGGLSGLFGAATANPGKKVWDEHLNARASAISDAEPVDGGEAAWIAARISADGKLHPNEEALLRFLKAEAPSIHPALRPLLERVA